MNSSKNKPAFSLQLKSAGPPTQMILSACSKQYEYPTAKSRLISASVERVSPFLTPREQTTQEKPEKPQTSARSTRSSFRNTTQTQLTPRDIQTLSKITSSFHTKPVTPSKTIRRVETNRSISSEKKRRTSTSAQRRYDQAQETSKQMREVGSQVFKAAQASKNLEEQVKILENRIAKLKLEEQNAERRLRKTKQMCNKIVENKERHHNELATSRSLKQSQMETLMNQRKKHLEEKMKLNQGILISLVQNMDKKRQAHDEVKQTLAHAKEIHEKEQAEKNKKRDKVIQEIQELRKRIVQVRQETEESAREHTLTTRKQEKLESERLKQEQLSKHLDELSQREEVLLEKIRATNTLQESEYKKMERAYSFRVSAERSVDRSLL